MVQLADEITAPTVHIQPPAVRTLGHIPPATEGRCSMLNEAMMGQRTTGRAPLAVLRLCTLPDGHLHLLRVYMLVIKFLA